MNDHFFFHARAQRPDTKATLELKVEVTGLSVVLSDVKGKIARGVWDLGQYVRYPQSQKLRIHPVLLDEIDRILRGKMSGEGASERAAEPNRDRAGRSIG